MRLERIFIHRVFRLLRWVLPVLVIALVAIPVRNYVTGRVPKLDSLVSVRKLPSGVSLHTEGFTYSRTEGGSTKFTVRAKQQVGYKGDKYMLEDVDVVVFGETEKDPPRNIRGKYCSIDQETSDFDCNGMVEVRLDAKTIVRTEKLIYHHADRTVIAPEFAKLEQEGRTGHANSLEYSLATGLLKLNGDVNIQTAEHAQMQAPSALVQQKENWATMSGGVLMKSANGWVRGSNAHADLEPGTYKPKLITVDGDVTGESRPQQGHEAWKFRGGWIEAGISADGNPERVKARSNVEIEKISGEPHQRVSGEEIDTILKDGKIENLDARQNASMVLGADQTLSSPQIWTNGSGSIRTAGRSVLKMGDSTIEGTDFTIENGEEVISFNSKHRATLKKAGEQESSSDQTRASFDNRSNMLIELVQTGHFQFHDSQREGRAESARFDNGGSVVTLQGSASMTDAQTRIEAPEIRLDQEHNSFVATKNVTTFMKSPSGKPEEQTLVKSAKAEGGTDLVVYTGNVQLWRGDAYVKAGRLEASGQQGQQSSRVHAEASTGSQVESNLQNIRARSDILDYDDAAGIIHYTGHVRGQKQDMIMTTPDMVVTTEDNNVKEILASGGVTVTRADEIGTGDRAVYDAATEVTTLTGKNAQVRDKDRVLRGSVLTMRNKGETVSAKGGDGQRTVTKHPVKTDKK